MDTHFIIDFDSTFIQLETLDELAKIVLKNNPKKQEIVKKIEDITKLGMEGKIGFAESLAQRMYLLQIEPQHIKSVINFLRKKITPSIARNQEFFKNYSKNIYIISGGFKEIILP